MIFDSISKLVDELKDRYHSIDSEQVSAYRKAWADYEEDVSSGRITAEYAAEKLEAAIDAADNIFSSQAQVLNDKLRAAVNSLRDNVTKEAASNITAADRSSRMSVALQLLQIEGEDITDNTAFNIMREFVEQHDFEALEQFHRVVERQCPEFLDKFNGETKWAKTFGDLYKFRSAKQALEEIEQTAEKMFVHPRKKFTDDNMSIKSFLPCDGYLQPFAEATLPEKVGELDNMLSELFPE